jgi:hypothetical protein
MPDNGAQKRGLVMLQLIALGELPHPSLSLKKLKQLRDLTLLEHGLDPDDYKNPGDMISNIQMVLAVNKVSKAVRTKVIILIKEAYTFEDNPRNPFVRRGSLSLASLTGTSLAQRGAAKIQDIEHDLESKAAALMSSQFDGKEARAAAVMSQGMMTVQARMRNARERATEEELESLSGLGPVRG